MIWSIQKVPKGRRGQNWGTVNNVLINVRIKNKKAEKNTPERIKTIMKRFIKGLPIAIAFAIVILGITQGIWLFAAWAANGHQIQASTILAVVYLESVSWIFGGLFKEKEKEKEKAESK